MSYFLTEAHEVNHSANHYDQKQKKGSAEEPLTVVFMWLPNLPRAASPPRTRILNLPPNIISTGRGKIRSRYNGNGDLKLKMGPLYRCSAVPSSKQICCPCSRQLQLMWPLSGRFVLMREYWHEHCYDTSLVVAGGSCHKYHLWCRVPRVTAGLTHWGLVTPYGDSDLGQHWLR